MIKKREATNFEAGEELLSTFQRTPKQPSVSMFTALSSMVSRMAQNQAPQKEKSASHGIPEESDEKRVIKIYKEDASQKQAALHHNNPDWPELETIIIKKQPSKKQRSANNSWLGRKEDINHQAVEDLLKQTNWRDLRHSIADCELQCSRLVSNYANRSMFNPVSPLETDPKEPADRQKTSP